MLKDLSLVESEEIYCTELNGQFGLFSDDSDFTCKCILEKRIQWFNHMVGVVYKFLIIFITLFYYYALMAE